MAIQRAEIDWRGAAVSELVRAAAARGLLQGAEHILTESRAVVPIEEATLERSGVASVDPDQLVAGVSFDTPYAVRQHEDLTARHDPGRHAKYLEGPMNAERDTAMELVAAAIRRATRS